MSELPPDDDRELDDREPDDGGDGGREIPDPRDTDHPAGDEHARKNVDDEPAG